MQPNREEEARKAQDSTAGKWRKVTNASQQQHLRRQANQNEAEQERGKINALLGAFETRNFRCAAKLIKTNFMECDLPIAHEAMYHVPGFGHANFGQSDTTAPLVHDDEEIKRQYADYYSAIFETKAPPWFDGQGTPTVEEWKQHYIAISKEGISTAATHKRVFVK